jgi:molybdopterin-containing oxidoreductase family iron-sulfur binding subunit
MDTGIVSQIYPRCFGCRYCMAACPYHVRLFNWWDPVWPDGMEKMLNQLLYPALSVGQGAGLYGRAPGNRRG